MYSYFCMHPKPPTITWATNMIEKFIDATHLFTKESSGNYKAVDFFCSIGLMKVTDWNSWSDNNYDIQETNYVSIVTSVDKSGKIPTQSMNVMKQLSALLSAEIHSDDE